MNIDVKISKYFHLDGDTVTQPIARLSGRLATSVFQWNTLLLAGDYPARWSRGFVQHAARLRNSLSLQGQASALQGHGRRALPDALPTAHSDAFYYRF